MTFNSMNHIHYCMYAYINLLSKVGFHSITSNYESENNQKTLKVSISLKIRELNTLLHQFLSGALHTLNGFNN